MERTGVVDYIVVGQGLAGSAVALQLIMRDKRIVVIDEAAKNNSSAIAAGIFNPITGRNAVKTWKADDIFPYLHHFYRNAEQITSTRFLHQLPLYRPFASVLEQNEWMGKSVEAAYQNYVDELVTEHPYCDGIKDPFGGLLLKQTGYLDTRSYISAVRELIRARGTFLDEHFDTRQMKEDSDRVTYKGISASSIIFCQGERGLESPLFSNLPLRPLKGETITIKTSWEKQVIINRGVYMVPGGVPGEYRVGSTYQFNVRSLETTGTGRQELERKFRDLMDIHFEVIRQDAGVRPTTNDRRPILGYYPGHEKLIVFNGLGTKGVSLAPYFSEVLIRWLEKTAPLNKDVILTRFK